jgi:1-aminocyclopropane-1-carboxylate deaminase
MGSDVRIGEEGFGIGHMDSLAKLKKEFEAEDAGAKAYYVPAGASNHPLGWLGFARWAFEVVEQERELGVFFDMVIFCAVTGSTFAGIIAGFRYIEKEMGGKRRKVIGINASTKPKETFEPVLRIARFTAAKIGMSEDDIKEEDVVLNDRYHCGCYGILGKATIDGINFGAQTEALITDPVYEGKSLADLMDMVKKGRSPKAQTCYMRSWEDNGLECIFSTVDRLHTDVFAPSSSSF